MRSAIVTGATGFIGTHLCKELLAHRIKVYALVRKEGSKTERISGAEMVYCGMDDYDRFEKPTADTFYHLAWEGATGPGRDDEELQALNVIRTIKALKAAKRAGCKRFVALGTVYERLVTQILAEPEHRKPDFYLLSKQSAHYLCLKLAQKLGIEFVWATIYQPIGRFIKREQIMSYAIAGLLEGNPPEFGPAVQPCDITAVEDIVYGLRLLGESRLSRQDYYIGSGNPMLLKEYLQKTKEILRSETDLRLGVRPDDGLRFSFDWYDISDLRKDTGYEVKTGFEKAVFNVVDWLKSGEIL